MVNDGEVTALAGSMALDDNAVLGVAMGSSLAAGFVTPQGNITTWLNELAFVPVDYREDAPVDEWSGDRGVGAQYFSQQAVGRLLAPGRHRAARRRCRCRSSSSRCRSWWPRAMRAPADLRDHRRLFRLHHRHYADFYEVRNLLVLGRVMTGRGRRPDSLDGRPRCCKDEFPEVAERIRFHIPDEKEKRHGQAIAAASLPAIPVQETHQCNFIIPPRTCSFPTASQPEAALARTTHLCISAHQDDIEIMAYHGIAECFGRKDKWFTGVVVTNGAGSPRSGIYGDYTDEEMQKVRLIEQRKAAYVGEYACQIQLGFTSCAGQEPEGDRRWWTT